MPEVQSLKEDLTLFDIGTKDVVSIDIDASLKDAVSLMYEKGLRDVIIIDNETGEFGILTISDIIREQHSTAPETSLRNFPFIPCIVESKEFFVKDVVSKYGINFNYICLIEDGKLVGIVSKTDIIANYDPKILAEYEQVINLIGRHKINYIPHDMPAKEAITLLENDLDDALIILKNKKAVGVVTTRDVLRIFANNTSLNVPISHYMSSPLQTLRENATVKEALDFITKKHFKRVIIADKNDDIIGIISQSELTRLLYNKWMDLTRKSLDIAKRVLEFEKIAMMDPLTQAYNRTKLEKVIEKEEERIIRYKISFYSIIIIDIDDFKSINDTYGHNAGDSILKEFVSHTQKFLRKNDILFRWGGEEFIIFLPQTNCKNAVIVAEKIRNIIANHLFKDGPERITCSFGVSTKRSVNDNVLDIIQRADNALYIAKRNGKNRVESSCTKPLNT